MKGDKEMRRDLLPDGNLQGRDKAAPPNCLPLNSVRYHIDSLKEIKENWRCTEIKEAGVVEVCVW